MVAPRRCKSASTEAAGTWVWTPGGAGRFAFCGVHRCTPRYNPTMNRTTMTVSEARASLPHVLDRVAGGDEVTITRHGRPVAVLVRPDSLRARRAAAIFEAADEVAGLLERARAGE